MSIRTPWGVISVVETKDANGRTTAIELRCPRGMEGEAVLRVGAEAKETRIGTDDTRDRPVNALVTLTTARDDDALGYVSMGWAAPERAR